MYNIVFCFSPSLVKLRLLFPKRNNLWLLLKERDRYKEQLRDDRVPPVPGCIPTFPPF